MTKGVCVKQSRFLCVRLCFVFEDMGISRICLLSGCETPISTVSPLCPCNRARGTGKAGQKQLMLIYFIYDVDLT